MAKYAHTAAESHSCYKACISGSASVSDWASAAAVSLSKGIPVGVAI